MKWLSDDKFQAVVDKPISQLEVGDPIWCMKNRMDVITAISTVQGKLVIQTKNYGRYFVEDLVVQS